MKHITIKSSRIKGLWLKRLEAMGYIVTIVLTSQAGAAELTSQQLKSVCAPIERLNQLPESKYSEQLSKAYDEAQSRLEKIDSTLQIDDVCDL